jgi:hypothetical protein
MNRERRDMAQESLLRKLDEVTGRIRLLEREKNEAMGKIQSLEREAGELRSLITLAEAKADEMLKGVPGFDMPKGQATPRSQTSNVPLASKGLEELAEPSSSQQEELKRRFPHAFTSA